MSAKTEVESTYEVPVDFAVPDLTGVSGVAAVDEPVTHRLDATYYDTPGLRLAARRVHLRRRSGGHDAGWHLKRPAGNGDRTEAHAPLGGRNRRVPAELAAEIRALSRGEPLAPVARVRTRRVERALRAADGTVLALVADDVVSSTTSGGAKAEPQRWRELEVELVDGDRQLLDAVDVALRAAGARPARIASKLARALGDRYPADEPPGTFDPPGRLLNAYLRQQRDAIGDNDPGVRRGDPEAVHAMRVATRRLRSTLRTFRPVLDADRTRPLSEEARWVAQALGEVRDADVMAGRLAAAVAAEPAEIVVGPVAAGIRERLGARHAQARVRLIEALDSPRYAAFLDALDDLVRTEPSGPVTATRLRRLANRAVLDADRYLDDALGLAPGTGPRDACLHEARKAYKRARYAVEAIAPLAGKPARRLTGRLTALQDLLGAHQDAIVTGELLRDLGAQAHLASESAFTYGLLHARQHEADERRLERIPRARRRARRPKVRRWLER
ncbi:CYTH and CHAD domain-containing protein [Planosporangium thailandense]|uniref:CYTH and CHAD domain-containing protein n=1 Tax=Planosporangium thailandense TaxID=765197 RepID=A0ABX0XUT5_9ACTN|nr:CYTH and CHAD domain-containing protein [Planosporangium thailandense]NJC69020.1 CYTH and CHAD domain-containing protein [Planosporangium thailandense]